MGKNLRRSLRVLSFLLIVFFLFTTLAPLSQDFTATAAGEGVWTAQVSGITRRLITVFFYNSSTGWAVGEAGTFIRTTNGGTTWTSQIIGGSINFRSIFFIDGQNGWLVGDGGYVARTSDGGLTWTKQSPPASNNLYAVRFLDLNNGLVVGDNGIIFQTTDGGTSWLLRASGTNHTLDSLYFVDTQKYWVTADSGIFVRSNDSGSTWVSHPSVATQANLEKLHFPSPTRGFAVGPNGTIISTSDSGLTWTDNRGATSHHLHSVFFTDADNGWIVGDNGTILDTNDSGKSWNLRSAGITSRLNDVFFVDGKNGWAVGDNGLVLRYLVSVSQSPTDASMTQDISESGAVKIYINIDLIRDPSSGQPRQVLKGIRRVAANMTFDGDGFSISGFQGVSPFDKADIRVRDLMGMATYEVVQTEAEPQAPLRLAEFYPHITGTTSKTYKVVFDFSSISSTTGEEITLPAPASLAFRRGDANADGIIDSKDPALISQFIAGKIKKDAINLLSAASVYDDGPSGTKVTIKDAMILAQKVAGVRNDELSPASKYWADMLVS